MNLGGYRETPSVFQLQFQEGDSVVRKSSGKHYAVLRYEDWPESTCDITSPHCPVRAKDNNGYVSSLLHKNLEMVTPAALYNLIVDEKAQFAIETENEQQWNWLQDQLFKHDLKWDSTFGHQVGYWDHYPVMAVQGFSKRQLFCYSSLSWFKETAAHINTWRIRDLLPEIDYLVDPMYGRAEQVEESTEEQLSESQQFLRQFPKGGVPFVSSESDRILYGIKITTEYEAESVEGILKNAGFVIGNCSPPTHIHIWNDKYATSGFIHQDDWGPVIPAIEFINHVKPMIEVGSPSLEEEKKPTETIGDSGSTIGSCAGAGIAELKTDTHIGNNYSDYNTIGPLTDEQMEAFLKGPAHWPIHDQVRELHSVSPNKENPMSETTTANPQPTSHIARLTSWMFPSVKRWTHRVVYTTIFAAAAMYLTGNPLPSVQMTSQATVIPDSIQRNEASQVNQVSLLIDGVQHDYALVDASWSFDGWYEISPQYRAAPYRIVEYINDVSTFLTLIKSNDSMASRGLQPPRLSWFNPHIIWNNDKAISTDPSQSAPNE